MQKLYTPEERLRKPAANPWKNIGCPESIWKDLNAVEKRQWTSLYRAFNTQINMPVGVHVLNSVVRDLAVQYASLAIWTLRLEKKEQVSGSTEAEDRDDPTGVRSQDEAR